MIKEHLTDLIFEGIDFVDAPDFVDAFVVSGFNKEMGRPLSNDELEEINANGALVHELLAEYLY